MSLLKIYTSSKTESQKTGYQNYFNYSLIKMDGDYIPAWYLIADDLTTVVYIQELAPKALYNGDIDIVTETNITALTYTTDYGNLRVYALKQAYTLTGVHRLKIVIDGTPYYSDIFMNINNDIPIYVRISSYEYIRIYKY